MTQNRDNDEDAAYHMDAQQDPQSSPIGKRIEAAQQRLGMTLGDLAEASGVSVSTIWSLKNEPDRKPQARTANRLAAALDVEPSWLSGDDGAESADELVSNGNKITNTKILEVLLGESRIPPALGSGIIRTFKTSEKWACFGIPSGATVIVDTTMQPKSGNLYLLKGSDGSHVIRYHAEPYFIGCTASGAVFHETRNIDTVVIGAIVASFSRH